MYRITHTHILFHILIKPKQMKMNLKSHHFIYPSARSCAHIILITCLLMWMNSVLLILSSHLNSNLLCLLKNTVPVIHIFFVLFQLFISLLVILMNIQTCHYFSYRLRKRKTWPHFLLPLCGNLLWNVSHTHSL